MIVLTRMFRGTGMWGSPPRYASLTSTGQGELDLYPPFMNHRDDVWPPDVQEFAPALQKHDRHFLRRQLTHGPSAVI